MTKQKRWPNNAENARLDAIAKASGIRRILAPILGDSQMSLTDILRRAGQAINLAGEIERILTAAKSGKDED